MLEKLKKIDWFWQNRWGLAALLVVGLVYWFFRSPHPGFHDSLSWVWVAMSGFDLNTNATSHFLYANLLHVLHLILPFVPVTLLLTMFSIAFSLAALWQIWRLGNIWFPGHPGNALAILMMGLAFTWWQQSEIIEVYTFNFFWFALLLRLALTDLQEGTHQRWWLVSLCFSIGLLIHIQNILSLPFFLFYLVRAQGISIPKRMLGLIFPAFAFFILLIPVLFLNMHSVSAIFFDNHFQSNVVGVDLKALGMGILSAIGFAFYNFHLFLIPIFWGGWLVWKNNRPLFWPLMFALIPYLGFAIKYSIRDSHVFFLGAWWVLIVFSLAGWKEIWERFPRLRIGLVAALILLSPIAYGFSANLARKMERFADLERRKSYKGGMVYFLWPGKRNAPDPLKIARKTVLGGETPPHGSEWNLPAAIKIVQFEKMRAANID